MPVVRGTPDEIRKAIKGKKIKVKSYTIDAATGIHTLVYTVLESKGKGKSK